jgi:glycosyltransferase involved in cell wall biosynthesis
MRRASREEPSISTLRVSAVICTRGRPDLIGAAVGSVLANDHDSFELLVIDQSADDLTRHALSDYESDPRLRYVHVDRVGLSFAYNFAISLSTAPLLAFTDDDCVAPADWLRQIESAFERHSDADLLYGQTIDAPELRGQGPVPAFYIRREELLGPGRAFRVRGMGANFAMRRRLVDQIGGFDEVLGGGGPLRSSQDSDLQFRTFRARSFCLLTPAVWVTHYGIRVGDSWVATLVAYGIGDGAFYMKHVRCGDLLALRLLIGRLARLTVREILNPIRRKPTQWPYLRSCFVGILKSLRYGVDRKRRLYRLTEATTS